MNPRHGVRWVGAAQLLPRTVRRERTLRAARLCQPGDPQGVTICIWRLFSQQKGMHVARPQQAGSSIWLKSIRIWQKHEQTHAISAQAVKYASTYKLMTNTILLANLFVGNITADNFQQLFCGEGEIGGRRDRLGRWFGSGDRVGDGRRGGRIHRSRWTAGMAVHARQVLKEPPCPI